MIDHDAAMRIADESDCGIDVCDDALCVLARAYKDVVRDALTPEEVKDVLRFCGMDIDRSTPTPAIAKLRRIARAATTKPERK